MAQWNAFAGMLVLQSIPQWPEKFTFDIFITRNWPFAAIESHHYPSTATRIASSKLSP
eukprot:CAMPEP_0174328872 /NCGR_PEP_ID=MMETSP0810-20121108/15434_1 /TAXON_ID=73025 ORGANISM="Eutreptiella gymnastica-like, Strain CCMP1594" /NCGR_SAMPLE_ID=MMETSP0810 /ASSEMBLY_ACC=CAM_ASM_000659 /LENGTH=57 /DNA_ID=CAMNT_0015443119 /DNA_START=625 /DNA_END=798 /DNA_ORIENTATION=+